MPIRDLQRRPRIRKLPQPYDLNKDEAKALNVYDEDGHNLYFKYCCAYAAARFSDPHKLKDAESFAYYRECIHPGMKTNWFTDELNWELQWFAEDLVAGLRPKLAIMAPPQHGKSEAIIDLVSWIAGRWPDLKVLYSSYSDLLGVRANRKLRRIIESPRYQEIFPDTTLGSPHSGYKNDLDEIEYAGYNGSFRNTTIEGQSTGLGLDLGVVDDPVKGRKEANSKRKRNTTWDWFTDDFLTRFDELAGLLIIMTRWHVDDLLGRAIIKFGKELRVLKWPAIATEDEEYRGKGEPLFPQWKSLNFLREQKSTLSDAAWQSLYQQSPYIGGGGQLPVNKMLIMSPFIRGDVIRSIRYWDKAGTAAADNENAAFTAGVLMHKMRDGKFVIENIVRGQWSAAEREERILLTSRNDAGLYPNYQVHIEQEPGPIWEEELVQTADGYRKPLKDIKRGDEIVNGCGELTEVLQVHKQGELPIVQFTTRSGRIIHSALNHPFLTPYGWVAAKRLKIGDRLALRLSPYLTVSSYPSLEECRLAGYMIGDGCMTVAGTSINAQLACSDPSQGKDIELCVRKLGGRFVIRAVSHNNYGRPTCHSYSLSGGIRDWIRQRGMAGWRTETKRVPDWIWTASKEAIAHFIGAFFAADGGVSISGGNWDITFYNTNKPLLQDIQSLLLRFSIVGRLRQRQQWHGGVIYRLEIRNGRQDDFAARFAEDIPVFGDKGKRLKTFRRRRHFDNEFAADEIVAISPWASLRCRCLTVAEGDSFLVNDVVVHNSGGKDSVEASVRLLSGIAAFKDKVTGAKEVRNEPFVAAVQNGMIWLVAGGWYTNWIEECETWPNGSHVDQVDAAGGAYNKLTSAPGYDRSYSGFQD